MLRRFLLLTAVAFAPSAWAGDALIDGAKLCTGHLPRYEREHGIPVHLLSAIAATESGRWHEGLHIAVPWPWTINADGKGYFFDSKQEAIAAVKRLQGQGVKSIDVGCMQVNLLHHPHAFPSLEAAFDPETNEAYASGFLRSLFDEMKSWKAASAAYHSRARQEGGQYVSQVYNRWYTIIERVRRARLNAGQPADTQLAAAASEAADGSAPVATQAAKAVPVKLAQAAAARPAPTIRVITASNAVPPDSGIIIVHPEIQAPETVPIHVAQSRPSDTVPPPSHIIRVSANTPADSAMMPRTGPRFIFTE